MAVMTATRRYGRDSNWDRRGLDSVVIVNEDLGLNANLVTGVNDTFETTIPYPSEWDADSEVMMISRILSSLQLGDHPAVDEHGKLAWTLSMIDRSATATFRGGLTDANDEWRKSIFTPTMNFGIIRSHGTIAATSNWQQISTERLIAAEYIPPYGRLPTFFPVFEEFYGQDVSVLDTDGSVLNVDFTFFENVVQDMDYEIRRMSSRERSMFQGLPGLQQRLAQLGS